VCSGVEDLLLEIYEDLPNGGAVTDRVLEQKMDDLIESVWRGAAASGYSPAAG
jgi:hypothetical protein